MHTYLDGCYLIVDKKNLEVLAPGKVSGKGVFETMIVVNGKIVFYQEHWRRLRRGLRLFKIKFPKSSAEVSAVIKELMSRQKLSEARVRLMVWRERNKNRQSVVVLPLVRPRPKKYQSGYKLTISSLRRNPTRYSHIKSVDYQFFHQAHAQALAKGFDEALLMNDKSDVVETAYANIFVVHDGKIFTPPIASGCLDGITRNVVRKLAVKSGLTYVTKSFSTDFLSNADEAFLTNSVIGIMPIGSINKKWLSGQIPGAITQQLMDLYQGLL